MSKINKIIQNILSIVYTDEDTKKSFPSNLLATLYRTENNLKGILPPFLFPPKFKKNESSISSYNKSDICKNSLIFNSVNLSLRLQVEFSLLEVACLLTAQIRFTLCLNNNNHLYLFSDKRLKNHKITK